MLPTINYQANDAPAQFVQSLHETGFGVLQNHPISQDSVTAIYQHWHAFFLSKEKQAFHYNVDTMDGYFPPDISETAKGYQAKDLKEYYHVYLWGRIPKELRAEITAYYHLAQALAVELLGWIETYSPTTVKARFSIPLPAMVKDSPQTLLRVLHYPPLTGQEHAGAIRAAPHEDINLLTVLPAADESGLQIKSNTGAWLDVPCQRGFLIINTGDMLQEASGHYFPSTTHRVVNPVGQQRQHSRLSLPLFLHPRPDVVLSERYTANSYLDERLRELGVK